jgi:hypothetical protein
MTERKPPGMRSEDWVRHQIRTAEDRGSFRDLPHSGRPLPASALRLDRDWVGELVRREQLDASVLLPLSITLAREVEQLPGRLTGERSERRVREIVVDLDDRIRDGYRQVLTGPPMRTLPLDVEAVVDRWRASRPPDPPPPAAPAPVSTPPPKVTGRWFALRSRLRRASVLGSEPLEIDDERSPI